MPITGICGNRVENASFEAGAWAGNSYVGEGSVELSEEDAPSGGKALQIIGTSSDSVVQAYSKAIPVTPGVRYRIGLEYKHHYGKASMQVRWADSGYVFSFLHPGEGWRNFEEGLSSRMITGIKYLGPLGDKAGREAATGATLTFPEGVHEVRIYFLVRGEGVLNISGIDLREEGSEEGKGSSSLQDQMQSEEAARLLMNSPRPQTAASTGEKLSLVIQDVADAPVRNIAPSAWPASGRNIRMSGEHFTRDGEPVFLLGLESVVVYPWLYRLLGVDFAHMQDTSMNGVMKSRKAGDTVTVSWDRPDWSEAQIRLLLDQGIAPYVQVYEEGRTFPLGGKFPELFANASHFFKFRWDDPQAEKLRLSMWKSVLNVTKNYPVFAYELFNEVLYMDYSPQNIASFHTAMEKKYDTIEKANTAWGTSFAAFEVAEPPTKGAAYSGYTLTMKPAGFSRPLWVDWQKHIEGVFADHLASLSRAVHAGDPNPDAYTTVQSVASLPQDYSGGPGIYPPAVIKAVDFFAAECAGGDYVAQTGETDLDSLASMLRQQMISSLVASLSEGKPVLDIEVPLRGYGRPRPAGAEAVIALAGTWKFKEDNRRQGEGLGFQNLDYDDADWKPITVPGLWGTQGFPECTFGWYRCEIEVPGSLRGQRLFLNGSKLTDSASIYVNGELVHTTRNWADVFGIDISPYLRVGEKNTFAMSISNQYRDAGMYWGGIRDYIEIDKSSYGVNSPITPGQMRSFLWQKLITGKSGVVPSYAYTLEGRRGSMFNPRNVSLEAIKAMPAIKKQIDEVGDIILASHRKPHSVALNFSFESGRARVYENGNQWLKGPSNTDLTKFYMALLFGGSTPDLVFNEAILAGRCDQHTLIVMRMSERVHPGVPEKLESYVRQGGVLLVDHGSVTINDDTHTPLHITNLLGIEVGGMDTATREVEPRMPYLSTRTATVSRNYDEATGCRIKLAGAEALLHFADGSPALTRHAVGKGVVYYLAAELPYEELQEVLMAILGQHEIVDPKVLVESVGPERPKPRFIQAHLFEKGSDRLLYVHNWGVTDKALIKVPSLAEGRYRVRRVGADGKAERLLSASELYDGIEVECPSQDPQILLIEEAANPARALPGLSAEHRRLLSLFRKSPKGGKRVLVNASRGEVMSKITMLTATHLLEEEGFQINTNLDKIDNELTTFDGEAISREQLTGYAIFATLGSAIGDRVFSEEELTLLESYVSEGGSLLLAANQVVGPNNWLSNTQAKGPLMRRFGVRETNVNVWDEKNATADIAMHPILKPTGQHPILTQVSKVYSLGSSVLELEADNAVELVRSTSDATPAKAPVMAALEHGKGRVIIMGDPKWLQPDVLAQGDNARLFLNMMLWLARWDERIGTTPDDLIQNRVRCEISSL